jgi:hypothetical protein
VAAVIVLEERRYFQRELRLCLWGETKFTQVSIANR